MLDSISVNFLLVSFGYAISCYILGVVDRVTDWDESMLVENVNLRLVADTPSSSVVQTGATTAAKPTFRPTSERVERTARPDEAPQRGRRADNDAPIPGEPKSRSRLAFDKELNRVFIEIVDLSSGEVVHRYPPEEIVRHIDALIKQQHLPAGQGNTGFLVDQSV